MLLLILIFFLVLGLLIFLQPSYIVRGVDRRLSSIQGNTPKDSTVKSFTVEKEKNTFLKKEKEGEKIPKESNSVATKKEYPRKGGSLVFIIDDAGYSLECLEPFLKFPWKITISVLPNLRYSRESAERIVRSGKDLLLHIPMEAISGKNPGPGAIFTGDTKERIFRKITKDFDSVPGAMGANNHMGSKVTSDKRTMDIVLEYFSNHGKFFIDSKTTSDSVVEREAEKWNVPVLSRDIFVDNKSDKELIKDWILRGMEIAKRRGYAILIGHVKSPQILDVLAEMSPKLFAEGFKFSGINDLIKKRFGKLEKVH